MCDVTSKTHSVAAGSAPVFVTVFGSPGPEIPAGAFAHVIRENIGRSFVRRTVNARDPDPASARDVNVNFADRIDARKGNGVEKYT